MDGAEYNLKFRKDTHSYTFRGYRNTFFSNNIAIEEGFLLANHHAFTPEPDLLLKVDAGSSVSLIIQVFIHIINAKRFYRATRPKVNSAPHKKNILNLIIITYT